MIMNFKSSLLLLILIQCFSVFIHVQKPNGSASCFPNLCEQRYV